MDNESMIEKLVELLKEANDLGHNAELQLDRELFAQWLIEHGVVIGGDKHEMHAHDET